MGGVISAIQDQLKQVDDKVIAMAKENLQQTQATAEKICDGFRLSVIDSYKNPNEELKWRVSGGRQDREDSFIGVATSSTPSTDVTAGVQSLIKGIFDAIGKKESESSFQGAISGMITGAFNAFLGNSSAGASTQRKFLIIPYKFAFYRVDICMYKYTFQSQGFKDHYESITVVYASRGILDITDLKASELLNYVSSITDGDQQAMTDWMKAFKLMYQLAQELIKDQKQPGARKPERRRADVVKFASAKEKDRGRAEGEEGVSVFSLPGPAVAAQSVRSA